MNAVGKRLAAVVTRIHEHNNVEVARANNNKNTVLWNNFRHLVEETGEVATCLRGTNDEPIENEAVDAAICGLAIALLETNGDITPLLDVMDAKMDKWELKLEKES